MNRSFFTPVLVLTVRRFGEDNRIATLLSSERGVFDAVLFGGPKSKLRSSVSPYHSGIMWFYNDETKHLIKITDFEPSSYRVSIRENLYKTYAASLCTELVIKTHGGGNDDSRTLLWTLVLGFMDGLDFSTEKESKLGTIRFLWRFLQYLGVQPDPTCCDVCGSIVSSSESDNDVILYYSDSIQGFVCTDCIQNQDHLLLPLSQQAIHYLLAMNTQQPGIVRKMIISSETMQQLHELVFLLISRASQTRLHSLESNIGIL